MNPPATQGVSAPAHRSRAEGATPAVFPIKVSIHKKTSHPERSEGSAFSARQGTASAVPQRLVNSRVSTPEVTMVAEAQ